MTNPAEYVFKANFNWKFCIYAMYNVHGRKRDRKEVGQGGIKWNIKTIWVTAGKLSFALDCIYTNASFSADINSCFV